MGAFLSIIIDIFFFHFTESRVFLFFRECHAMVILSCFDYVNIQTHFNLKKKTKKTNSLYENYGVTKCFPLAVKRVGVVPDQLS